MHVGRFILFLFALLAFVAAGLARARRRHLRRRPLGGARRRDQLRRGGRGHRLRPWLAASRSRPTGSSPTPMSSPRPSRRQEGRTVSIGVVPSQGAQASRARIVAIDPARDLALLEVEDSQLPPIPLYVGPLDDGAPIAALGYPGNVDLATARSADDYIQPLPPTRSVGIFSNVRPINGITTLLHTANIARGHSGGPLLDQCGRVLGVNTLITRNQDGDAPFAFAVANRELTAFLGQARQPYQSVTTPCVSMSDRLRQDEERAAAEERARQQAAEARRAQGGADARAQRRRDQRRCGRTGSLWRCCCWSSRCSPSAAASCWSSRTGRTMRRSWAGSAAAC